MRYQKLWERLTDGIDREKHPSFATADARRRFSSLMALLTEPDDHQEKESRAASGRNSNLSGDEDSEVWSPSQILLFSGFLVGLVKAVLTLSTLG